MPFDKKEYNASYYRSKKQVLSPASKAKKKEEAKKRKDINQREKRKAETNLKKLAKKNPDFLFSTMSTEKPRSKTPFKGSTKGELTEAQCFHGAMEAFNNDKEVTMKQAETMKKHSQNWHERSTNHQKILAACTPRRIRKQVMEELGMNVDCYDDESEESEEEVEAVEQPARVSTAKKTTAKKPIRATTKKVLFEKEEEEEDEDSLSDEEVKIHARGTKKTPRGSSLAANKTTRTRASASKKKVTVASKKVDEEISSDEESESSTTATLLESDVKKMTVKVAKKTLMQLFENGGLDIQPRAVKKAFATKLKFSKYDTDHLDKSLPMKAQNLINEEAQKLANKKKASK